MTNLDLSRPLMEKQARMRTIASAMVDLDHMQWIASTKMGDFSTEEAHAFHDAVDMLEHFITLASART